MGVPTPGDGSAGRIAWIGFAVAVAATPIRVHVRQGAAVRGRSETGGDMQESSATLTSVFRIGWLRNPWVTSINQILHLFFAASIIAVPVFMLAMVIPGLEKGGAEPIGPGIVTEFYSVFPLVAAVVMFVTGAINYLVAFGGSGLGLWQSMGTGYGVTVLIKLAIVELLNVLGVLLGRSESMQADAETWLMILAAIGLVLVVFSSVLRRGTLGMTR